ncbi:HPF/RaiA family ribosome-associated protein [Zhongshania sp.]|jgi:putative sigma-54 modulation protein|uniref:HPF/RaiA family ribosome-associated protein n=1 Tax=Zhongshania sp. TaxID=1971902 RepID=UPI0039E72966
MRINLKLRHVSINQGLEEYVRRRMDFALATRYPQTHQIDVTLSDINGPRGGEDKRCQVRIMMAGQSDIVIDDVQDNWQVAIDKAASRANRTFTRRLAKSRSKNNRPSDRSNNWPDTSIEAESEDYLYEAGEH